MTAGLFASQFGASYRLDAVGAYSLLIVHHFYEGTYGRIWAVWWQRTSFS